MASKKEEAPAAAAPAEKAEKVAKPKGEGKRKKGGEIAFKVATADDLKNEP